VVVGGLGREYLVGGNIGADGLQHHVESGRRAEGGEDARGIKAMGTEVMEDDPAVIQQGLDVDQLDRPDAALEDATADVESLLTGAGQGVGAIEVVCTGGAEDARGAGRRDLGGRARGGCDQNLAQLNPAMRADDDRLSPFERITRLGGEPADLTHESVANEVRAFHEGHCNSPPRVAARRVMARIRVLANRKIPYNPVSATGRRLSRRFADRSPSGGVMSRARCTLKVEGLDCPVEVEALNAALKDAPGIVGLTFDLLHGVLTVDHDPVVTNPDALITRIADRAGMRAVAIGRPEIEATPPESAWRALLRRWGATAGAGLALGAALLAGWLGLSTLGTRVLYGLAVAIGGLDLFPHAWRSLRNRNLDIHVLMALAVLGALALGQWDEAATVAFLFGLSEALEGVSLERARRAVRALLEVAPQTAELIGPDGQVTRVAVDRLTRGDRVHVRSGERVPVDGVVFAGRSSVDQSSVTGESVPILREPGDEVFAGTVNGDGVLEIEASGPVGDALISRVIARVRAAQAGKAPVERRLARFAAWYTPLVVIVALGVMVGPPAARLVMGVAPDWLGSFSRGLVVLVIACPCALVIATPVAIVSALASAARRGVLVKGGQFLEEIGRLRVLAFDKTGTLTRGEPDVVEVVAADGRVDDDVLRIAAALGDRGGHVLGRAIARHARARSLDVPQAHDYTAYPGLGAQGRVDAEPYHIGSHRYLDESGLCLPEFHARLDRAEQNVGTSVAVSGASGPVGWVRLADQPRPEAARVLAELNALGIQTVMLTGDNLRTAAAMAAQLGMTEHRSGLLPDDKVSAVAELDARHGPTGMVGDGVNDAPALAAARVSVALGGISSGAALESADIVLMADDLGGLPWIIRHSRRTLARIRENIILALVTKAIVLVLAVFGVANLWMAIGADVGTSLLVTLNALRLLRA
jgi:Zn2+/Cd2+-exporting ATPase